MSMKNQYSCTNVCVAEVGHYYHDYYFQKWGFIWDDVCEKKN